MGEVVGEAWCVLGGQPGSVPEQGLVTLCLYLQHSSSALLLSLQTSTGTAGEPQRHAETA